MKISKVYGVFVVIGLVLGISSWVIGAEAIFKDYDVVVIEEFTVPSGSPAPDSAGLLIAEKVAYQLRRYSEKYNLFENIIQEGRKGKEMPSGKKILLIKGEVKEYSRTSVGRRIGRSFIPGGEFTGTAAFAAKYQFIDRETGKVVYETDLRTTSTGSDDTVEYAMDRNGEAAAKLITKYKR